MFIALAVLLATAIPDPVMPADSFRGVRVLKVEGAGLLRWSVEFPEDCPRCRLISNEFTTAQNPKEFYFHFAAPAQQNIRGVRLHVTPSKVRRVICGRTSTNFVKTDDEIVFDVAPQRPEDLVAEIHTEIRSPGVSLRIEHADVQRRNGPYAKGRWPATERAAVLNLQFAARDAIHRLALDRQVVEKNLGVIQVMGFDTNYPTLAEDRAHDDFPPHWHLHLWWATDPKIRTIDHLFVEENGRLSHNHVARNKGIGAKQRDGEFAANQTFEVLTPDDEVLFTETITSLGGFVLAAQSHMCSLTPVNSGFQSGARVACDVGRPVHTFRVTDDLDKGLLRIYVDDRLVEKHVYDPDTGMLKKSTLKR